MHDISTGYNQLPFSSCRTISVWGRILLGVEVLKDPDGERGQGSRPGGAVFETHFPVFYSPHRHLLNSGSWGSVIFDVSARCPGQSWTYYLSTSHLPCRWGSDKMNADGLYPGVGWAQRPTCGSFFEIALGRYLCEAAKVVAFMEGRGRGDADPHGLQLWRVASLVDAGPGMALESSHKSRQGNQPSHPTPASHGFRLFPSSSTTSDVQVHAIINLSNLYFLCSVGDIKTAKAWILLLRRPQWTGGGGPVNW